MGRSRAVFGSSVLPLGTLCMLAVTSGADAQRWTVEDAVAHALSNPAVEARLEAQIAGTRAAVAEETAIDTPSLEVAHEQVFGDDNIAMYQITASVEQTFDLSGWRRQLRRATPHREAALRAQRDQYRLEVASAVRRAFFEVRLHEERIVVMDRWIERLQTGVEAIGQRRESGDASPYDELRVSRELDLARARKAAEESARAEAWSQLRGWLPIDVESPTLNGSLTPEQPEDADAYRVPRVAELEALELSLETESGAWGSPFWRGWTLGGGYRFAQQMGSRGHGFVVSLSVPLSFWNTDAPRVERLEAELSAVRSELRLEQTLSQQLEDAARERVERCLTALSQVPAPEGDARLSLMASTAYSAGEGTLTEMLDAYGSETELQLARIELQWEARRASIELQQRRGTGANE